MKLIAGISFGADNLFLVNLDFKRIGLLLRRCYGTGEQLLSSKFILFREPFESCEENYRLYDDYSWKESIRNVLLTAPIVELFLGGEQGGFTLVVCYFSYLVTFFWSEIICLFLLFVLGS